jgi:hypothetical protein
VVTLAAGFVLSPVPIPEVSTLFEAATPENSLATAPDDSPMGCETVIVSPDVSAVPTEALNTTVRMLFPVESASLVYVLPLESDADTAPTAGERITSRTITVFPAATPPAGTVITVGGPHMPDPISLTHWGVGKVTAASNVFPGFEVTLLNAATVGATMAPKAAPAAQTRSQPPHRRGHPCLKSPSPPR